MLNGIGRSRFVALASTALIAVGLSACATPADVAAPVPAAVTDTLAQGFADPPNSARPRVWWHWMNGNITQQGIANDLAWMDRVGIGGFQNFDASLQTPQIVENRLVYMTPEWRDAFRFAASEAARLDLEMAIAASPGWSETGGPWVLPEDGMKKLVWGETRIAGGRAFRGKINRAPDVTGGYQTMGDNDPLAALQSGEARVLPVLAGQVAVLAVPLSGAAMPAPRFSVASGGQIDSNAMADADLANGAVVALDADLNGAIVATYPGAVTVRNLRLAVPGMVRPFRSSPVRALLEARVGEEWRKVADLPITAAPGTHAFAPVTAREFRLRIERNPDIMPTTEMDGVPGAVPIDIFAFDEMTSVVVADFRLGNESLVDRAEEKAGYGSVYDYYQIASNDRTPVGRTIENVIDLTDRVAADGTLDWTPPAGSDWLVLDIGWSLTGKTNHPAPIEATGLEVDKFDPAAVRRYLEHYLGMYRETVGDDLFGARGLRALLTDSIEVGFANWTPAMEAEFAERRGYALRPWLPALTGLVIGSPAETERFLYDYRQTLAELVTDYHYGTVADVAHEQGLIVYGEALEDKRPMLGDDLSMRRYADVPMAALWTFPRGGQVRTTLLGDMKGAASTAHVYGQQFVAAESMTAANSPWAFAPRDLRRLIDLEFAYGINRPVIHTSVHVPVEDRKPGLSLMIFGQYFNRNETWAEMAGPWVDYMSRTAYVLQQGEYFADIAFFKGEEAPVTAQFATAIPDGLPTRYAFDFVNADMLEHAFSVDGGQLVSTGGTRYRVLALGPDAAHMTLPTLQRIAALVDAGATLVGHKPSATPSLADDAAAFAALANRLWANPRVIDSDDAEAALAGMGVGADFSFDGGGEDAEILFLHRALDDGHAFFLTNRQNRAESITAHFRVTGLQPEWWDAVSGAARPLSFSADGQFTAVPLQLGPEESGFVVFREPTAAASSTYPAAAVSEFVTLDAQPWQLTFQEGRGAPTAPIVLDSLRSLTSFDDPGIRYFSGTATYATDLMLPNFPAGEAVWLDLGQVGDVAEVWVNGQKAGTSWWSPDRVNIAPFAGAGRNRIEVRVANLWANRLIGDVQPGAERVTFVAAPTYLPDAPLRPSGLIGPVRLLVEE